MSDVTTTSEGDDGDERIATTIPPDLARDVRYVLDMPSAERLLDVCCNMTGLRFAAIARVSGTRWIVCAVQDRLGVGLSPGQELPARTAPCHEVLGADTEIVIEDAESDDVYRDHPCPSRYGFRSCISVPIRLADGDVFGTLCAFDPEPIRLGTNGAREMFRLFADLIAVHLDGVHRAEASETALVNEIERSRLQEELIAVLGHDLRNPLASIDANAQLIDALAENESVREPAGTITRSVHRMAELIANLLDFTRGRLGDGLELDRRSSDGLADQLRQVIDELRVAHPARAIVTRIDLSDTFACDPDRVAQLLSNLVGNALVHGSPDEPVEIEAVSEAGEFHLSVGNGGEPIPESIRAQLFQPFRRADGPGTDNGALGGLGLGLHIAQEIALAHRGTLSVDSDEWRTRFVFRMPCEMH